MGGGWVAPASIYLLKEERKELDDEAHGGSESCRCCKAEVNLSRVDLETTRDSAG